ncbi:MAG: hydrogenase expression/formation protein HypE [Thermococcaceae archaeon]|nr:hydrogenase expression/formation protein HypE [Thermococcaceae archaeon]
MLPAGKVPPEVLEKLFKRLGASDPRVLLGPGKGIDFGAVDFGEKILVASTDPITGAVEDIGFYAVHVNANDVAVAGARPKWFLLTMLLPEESDERLPERIMEEIDREAKKLGIAVIGGHTEVTPGLDRPIVIGTMLGEVERENLVRPDGAKPGDAIILTKWAGLEGTSIIAHEKGGELEKVFGREFVEKAKSFIEMISVVKDALLANEIGVHAMHDPTEGGIANGLHEMADSAGLGFRVVAERIPIREETRQICEFYKLNPLALISSGALLIAVRRDKAEAVVQKLLENSINASIIGEFLDQEDKRVIVEKGIEKPLERPVSDELWKVF